MPSDMNARLRVLKWLLVFSVASTGLHYTHNFFEVDSYPETAVPGWVVQAAILLFWPVLTVAGVRGYRLYRQGRLREAHLLLGVYSLTGLTTPLHFIDGNPEIPAFFYVTIFTDGVAGAAILAFVSASIGATRRGALPPDREDKAPA
jgi:hypothetical protein